MAEEEGGGRLRFRIISCHCLLLHLVVASSSSLRHNQLYHPLDYRRQFLITKFELFEQGTIRTRQGVIVTFSEKTPLLVVHRERRDY